MSNIETMRYDSLAQFCAINKVQLPLPRYKGTFAPWRLVKGQPAGEINGLPTLAGKAVATNGILVAVENEHGEVFFGHLSWFKCYKESDVRELHDQIEEEDEGLVFQQLMADFNL